MDTIEPVIRGMMKALDPVGYIAAAPTFAVQNTVFRGGLKIEQGKIDGWNILRYSRKNWEATAIVAYSDGWFVLKAWGDFPEDGLRGIMNCLCTDQPDEAVA